MTVDGRFENFSRLSIKERRRTWTFIDAPDGMTINLWKNRPSSTIGKPLFRFLEVSERNQFSVLLR